MFHNLRMEIVKLFYTCPFINSHIMDGIVISIWRISKTYVPLTPRLLPFQSRKMSEYDVR